MLGKPRPEHFEYSIFYLEQGQQLKITQFVFDLQPGYVFQYLCQL